VTCEGEVLGGVDGAEVAGVGLGDAEGCEVEGHGSGVVSPVCDGEDFARRGQVAEPDVVFFFGLAAGELGLRGERALVKCGYIFVRQNVQRCLRETIRLEGRADDERSFVDGPHAKMETLFIF
jgi:hypothetical protein